MERKKLTEDEVETALTDAEGWRAGQDRLERRYTFTNFAESLAFVNRVAEVAEALNHHPDIKLGWGYAVIESTTHDRGGITDFDFALARRINALENNEGSL